MSKWVPSWRYVPIDYNQQIGVFENITQKSVFTNNLSGQKIRVRLNNLYSDVPMKIRHGAIALRNRVTGALSERLELTLDKKTELVIPANSTVYTDEISHSVSWQEDFILWLYYPYVLFQRPAYRNSVRTFPRPVCRDQRRNLRQPDSEILSCCPGSSGGRPSIWHRGQGSFSG